MGCWNATCNISNLPILRGDKVVFIPLMRVKDKANFNCCYPADNFVPLGFPIIGKYDEYGGLEDIETSEMNKEYFKSLNFYYKNHYNKNPEEYKKASEYECFEDLLRNILCCVEGCFVEVKENGLLKDGKAEINYMMIHYDLYFELYNNMANRIPYDKKETYETILTRKLKEKFEKTIRCLDDLKDLEKEMEETSKNSVKFLERHTVHNISNEIFNKQDTFYNERWDFFSNIMIKNESKREELLKCAVHKFIMTSMLSYMRKGFLCDSGCGSQSEETKLHVIMANFILKRARKKGKEEMLIF